MLCQDRENKELPVCDDHEYPFYEVQVHFSELSESLKDALLKKFDAMIVQEILETWNGLHRAKLLEQGPEGALFVGESIDKGPADDVREICCTDPYTAWYYAQSVDRAPRDDTRQAACGAADTALNYARSVDCGPRDDTRAAASRVPSYALKYARLVDKKEHPETLAGADGDKYTGSEYRTYFAFDRQVSKTEQ